MTTNRDQEYTALLKQQIATLKKENRFLEFKSNYQEADKLGRYISALSNGACLDNEETAYLYFGVEDETLELKGTTFDAAKIKVAGKRAQLEMPSGSKLDEVKAQGNQSLEMYLRQMVSPKIDFKIEEFYDEVGHRLVVFIIPSAKEEPTCYKGTPYVRVDSS